MQAHGHSQSEIEARIGRAVGHGVLRDTVYGAIDGAVTTFAIVAGVAGAGLSPIVIIALGLANVLADGFSMAAGNYSGTKAERDNLRRLRAIEENHIATYPQGERRELRHILSLKGLSGKTLDRATEEISKDHENWIGLMLEGEYGVSGIQPNPLRGALATFIAFLTAGMIPLLPFLFGVQNAFFMSSVITLAVFFGIGAIKSSWSLAPWWRSGIETLLIGGVAAAIAYWVGAMFHA